MAMRKREDEVFPNAAAIDIGASSHWASVPPHGTDAPVGEFGAMTDDLNAMADWLLACGVNVVAMGFKCFLPDYSLCIDATSGMGPFWCTRRSSMASIWPDFHTRHAKREKGQPPFQVASLM